MGKRAYSSSLMAFTLTLLVGCASTIPEPHQPSDAHISVDDDTGSVGGETDIPDIVQQQAYLPPPVPKPQEQDLERYTVVVNDVPVKELLFALARDASLNIDVDSDIDGYVTLNAVEQTLPQILERISRQSDLRYELQGNNLYISPDEPYFRTYKVDYLNIERDSEGSISIATQISTTGTVDVGDDSSGGGGSSGGNNNSTTTVKNTSKQYFWSTLEENINGIIDADDDSGNSVIVNAESGVVSVKATSRQHLDIQTFLDQVLRNSQRQVLIEATIVEVTLNNRFQSGVDWNAVIGGDVLTLTQNTLTGTSSTLGGPPFFSAVLSADNPEDFGATLKLLKTFGDVKVLSSPKLMALNNQAAVLKVVENEVYFTFDSEISQSNSLAGGQNLQSIESEVHTVPVGLVMSVTPQINENMAVTMNVRPTISSIVAQVPDPGPALIAATSGSNITVPVSEIPQIAVREMESILTVNSGQTAVLGGLMTDDYRRNTNGIPGLGDIPEVGSAFKIRDFQNTKSELIIFLRPVVMRNASLNGDLAPYRQYLRDNVNAPLPIPK